jgi:hypothetical protein
MGAGAFLAATPGGDLPDSYLIYFVVDVSPVQHADNLETIRGWLVQVSIYSRAGLAGLPDVIGAMTAAGFMFVAGRQLDYDIETRHYGIAFDFEWTEDL